MGVKPGKCGATETKRKKCFRKEGLVNWEMLLQSSSQNSKVTPGFVHPQVTSTLPRAISAKMGRENLRRNGWRRACEVGEKRQQSERTTSKMSCSKGE